MMMIQKSPPGGIFLQKLGKDDVINRYLLCLVVEFCEFSGNVMFVLGVFSPSHHQEGRNLPSQIKTNQ